MKTRTIDVGGVKIGGGHKISVQTMCTTKTTDIQATLKQISEIENAGCDIVRLAVPDQASAEALRTIRKETSIPLVADIHFDWKLAVASAPYVDKLRINPGNIGSGAEKVIEAAKEHSIPIRIGVNLGSLENAIRETYGPTADGMVASAGSKIGMLEENDFTDIIVSLKASDIATAVAACKKFSEQYDYPQHIGITESGTSFSGTIKSSIGIGILLSQGIGDTIRVSLSASPVSEVRVGREILKSLGLQKGLIVTSCPTCARSGLDVETIARKIEEELGNMRCSKRVAVMGCAVNGPGEAKGADVAIVGAGEKDPLLFVDGVFKAALPKGSIITRLKEELLR